MTQELDPKTKETVSRFFNSPEGMGRPVSRLTREDARVIFAGLVHDAIDARKLTPAARDEIRAALDKLLEITATGVSQQHRQKDRHPTGGGMILSGQSIRRRGIFTPFSERTKHRGMTYGLGPAGYDVRIAEDIYLDPGEARLASTLEHFNMPNDLLGKVADKSTWARNFVAVQNTIIEPGWRGHLTIELSNHSNTVGVEILAGDPIAQIILSLLDEPTEQPYAGKYQDQRAGAVAAILEG